MAPRRPYYKLLFSVVLNLCFLVLVGSFFLPSHLRFFVSAPSYFTRFHDGSCQDELRSMAGHASKCFYLRTHSPCEPQGYIDYLQIFYCDLSRYPAAGYALAATWLLVLFYLLGSTASRYFCNSLQGLSAVLRLPPAVAGVTLLALGNGAPDVFASIVSFGARGGGTSTGDVGLSSTLGGALFVSTVVAGAVAFAAGSGTTVDRRGFFRDVGFLLVGLAAVLWILIDGQVTLLTSVCFVSLFFVYVTVVCVSHCRADAAGITLPAAADLEDCQLPLLDPQSSENPVQIVKDAMAEQEEPFEPVPAGGGSSVSKWAHWVLFVLHLPLHVPRRLTIPDVSDEHWSKPCAVGSAALAPVMLAVIWLPRIECIILGVVLGVVLGALAAMATESRNPPKKCLLPWLAGGFLMSITWAYVTARELVTLLVAIGHMAGIDPAVLGGTVLAWGNSASDLMSDVAMVMHGGAVGAQIAVSGCYAGPLFNTVVGVGMSLVLACAAKYPAPVEVPVDGALYETLVFLAVGLAWAALALGLRGMKLDRVLGIGLWVVYLTFLCIRLGDVRPWGR